MTKCLAVLMLIVTSANAQLSKREKISSSTAFGDQVVTHIADGGDWKTSITLFNLSSSRAVTFTMNFYSDNGSAHTFPFKNIGNFSSLNGVIPVNGSLSFETGGFTNGSTTTGWAYVDTNDSIGGFAIFTDRNGQEATVPLESWIAEKEILAFDNTNGNVMGIALVNPIDFLVSNVTITFYDRNGHLIGSEALTLGANEHVSYVMPSMWPYLANRAGTAYITCDSFGVSVLGLRFNPHGAFTTVIPIEPTSI